VEVQDAVAQDEIRMGTVRIVRTVSVARTLRLLVVVMVAAILSWNCQSLYLTFVQRQFLPQR